MPRRVSAIALLVVVLGLVLGLTGCVQPDVTPSPSPPVSDAPLFASEEEALAAATEAYAEYLKVSDAVGREGWSDSDPLEEVAVDPALAEEQSSAETFNDLGYRLVGTSAFDSMRLQQMTPSSIDTYLCLDLTDVAIVDALGNSVAPADRPDRFPIEIGFDLTGTEPRVERSEPWSGADFC